MSKGTLSVQLRTVLRSFSRAVQTCLPQSLRPWQSFYVDDLCRLMKISYIELHEVIKIHFIYSIRSYMD